MAIDGSINLGTTFLTLSSAGISGTVSAGSITIGDPENNNDPNYYDIASIDGTGYAGKIAIGESLDLPPLKIEGSLEGPLPLPRLTLSGALATGEVMTGAVECLAASAAGVLLNGAAGVGDALLPVLSLAASNGVRGNAELLPLQLDAAALAGQALSGALRLAVPTLAATALNHPFGSGAAVLPLLATLGSGVAGQTAAGAAVLQEPTLTAVGWTENPATGDGVLAHIATSGTLAGGTLASAKLLCPALMLSGLATQVLPATAAGGAQFDGLRLDAIGLAGSMATGAAILGPVAASGEGMAHGMASGDASLLPCSVAATLEAGNVGLGAVSVALLSAAGDLAAGNLMTAALTLPLVTLAANGAMASIGTASLTLPVLAMAGMGGTLEATLASPVFTGIALNTRSHAVSVYAGIPANSLAQFAGLTLAATAAGIVALTGETDLGAPIAAHATGGVSDLGSDQIKRVLAGYVGYRADGDMELTLITDSHHEHVYRLTPRRIGDQHATRIKFGRGVAGRYWQWTLANRAGADFALDSLGLSVESTSRRV